MLFRIQRRYRLDRNTFRITGGVVIGAGGSTSSPTPSASTQAAVICNGISAAGTVFNISDPEGNSVVSCVLPRTMGSMCVLVRAPQLVQGADIPYRQAEARTAQSRCGMGIMRAVPIGAGPRRPPSPRPLPLRQSEVVETEEGIGMARETIPMAAVNYGRSGFFGIRSFFLTSIHRRSSA